MLKVKNTLTQTTTLTTAAPIKTLDFYFEEYNEKLVGNGNICVNVLLTTVSGDTNKLTLTATPIISNNGAHNVPANGQETLVSALDWTSASYYTYPISSPFGPCIGLRLTANITGVEAGTELTLAGWVCYA